LKEFVDEFYPIWELRKVGIILAEMRIEKKKIIYIRNIESVHMP
jgi:hypothetical protein